MDRVKRQTTMEKGRAVRILKTRMKMTAMSKTQTTQRIKMSHLRKMKERNVDERGKRTRRTSRAWTPFTTQVRMSA